MMRMRGMLRHTGDTSSAADLIEDVVGSNAVACLKAIILMILLLLLLMILLRLTLKMCRAKKCHT